MFELRACGSLPLALPFPLALPLALPLVEPDPEPANTDAGPGAGTAEGPDEGEGVRDTASGGASSRSIGYLTAALSVARAWAGDVAGVRLEEGEGVLAFLAL